MPYVERPGWLTEIINNALGTYQQFRGAKENRLERERAENQREFDRKKSRADAAANLATTGQIGLPEQQAAFDELIPGIKLSGETPMQSRSRILKMPEKTSLIPRLAKAPMFGETQREPTASIGQTTEIPGRDSVSDEQLKIAGLETSTEKRAKRLQSTIVDIQSDALNGQLPTSEAAAGLAGVMTASGEQLKKLTSYMPVLDKAASQFVGGVINKYGGRINPKRMDKLVNEAYNEFVTTSTVKIPQEMDMTARAYFSRAMRDEYMEQLKLDVDRLAAQARYASVGSDPHQIFSAIDQSVRTQATILNNAVVDRGKMSTGLNGQMMQYYMNMPEDSVKAVAPQMVEPIRRAREADTKIQTGRIQLQQSINQRNTEAARLGFPPITNEELANPGDDASTSPTGIASPAAPSNPSDRIHAQATEALSQAKTEGIRKAILADYKKITGKDYK